MLRCKTLHPSTDIGEIKQHNWQQSQGTSGVEAAHIKTIAHRVFEVEADGDEMFFVLMHFEGLYRRRMSAPNEDIRVLRWYGDDAKFIAGNLYQPTSD